MLCEKCKVREANIKYTEIINGVKTEHNFCSHCAKEMDFGQYTALLDGEFPLGKLLSGLLGLEEDEEETDERFRVVCPTCGTSFDDFVQNSRFGCPDCYGVFDLLISDNIKQLQGSDAHKGKHPKYHRQESETSGEFGGEAAAQPGTVFQEADTVQEQIRILEARRQEAVRREDYETAALCRDKIKALREENGE